MDILLDKSKFDAELMFYFFQCDIELRWDRNPNSSKIQSPRLHMMESFDWMIIQEVSDFSSKII